MVIIDYILIGAFLVSVVVGFFRGFFREVMSLVTWVLAAWVAWRFSWLLEPALEAISSPALRLWLARAAAFVIVLLLGGLAGFLLAKIVKASGLTGTDRVLGMVFGGARGVLIIGLLVLVFQLLELDREPWWDDSVIVPQAARVADRMRAALGVGLERLEEAVDAPTE
ncbi:MAG: CvpA family protein [Gammaproteobacteria bacterium]